MKGNVTNTGYWPNSPDRNNDYNIIPSNEITTVGMNMPLIGISNTGDMRLMRPNENHKFNGDYVTEFPIRNQNDPGWGVQTTPTYPSRYPLDPGFDRSLTMPLPRRIYSNPNHFANGGDISIPNLKPTSWLDKYQKGGRRTIVLPDNAYGRMRVEAERDSSKLNMEGLSNAIWFENLVRQNNLDTDFITSYPSIGRVNLGNTGGGYDFIDNTHRSFNFYRDNKGNNVKISEDSKLAQQLEKGYNVYKAPVEHIVLGPRFSKIEMNGAEATPLDYNILPTKLPVLDANAGYLTTNFGDTNSGVNQRVTGRFNTKDNTWSQSIVDKDGNVVKIIHSDGTTTYPDRDVIEQTPEVKSPRREVIQMPTFQDGGIKSFGSRVQYTDTNGEYKIRRIGDADWKVLDKDQTSMFKNALDLLSGKNKTAPTGFVDNMFSDMLGPYKKPAKPKEKKPEPKAVTNSVSKPAIAEALPTFYTAVTGIEYPEAKEQRLNKEAIKYSVDPEFINAPYKDSETAITEYQKTPTYSLRYKNVSDYSPDDIIKVQSYLDNKGYFPERKKQINIDEYKTPEQALELQKYLANEGLLEVLGVTGDNIDGNLSGKIDKKTLEAVRQYNMYNQKYSSGQLDNNTRDAINEYKNKIDAKSPLGISVKSPFELYDPQTGEPNVDLTYQSMQEFEQELMKRGYFTGNQKYDFNLKPSEIKIGYNFRINPNQDYSLKDDARVNGNIVEGCAQYVNGMVCSEDVVGENAREELGFKGDAWTLSENIQNKGGRLVFSGIPERTSVPLSPKATETEVSNYLKTTLNTDATKGQLREMLKNGQIKPGDVVNIFYEGSPSTKKAWNQTQPGSNRFFTTHVGIVKADDDGKLYIEHNVHKDLQKQPIEDFIEGKVMGNSRNKVSLIAGITRPNYFDGVENDGRVPAAGVSYYQTEYGQFNPKGALASKTDYAGKSVSGENTYKFLSVIEKNKDAVLKDIPITENEFGKLMRVARVIPTLETYAKTDTQTSNYRNVTGNLYIEVDALKAGEALGLRDEVSMGFTRLKDEANLNENLRQKLYNNDDYQLNDPTKAALPTFYTLSKNYLYLKEVANEYELNMTSDQLAKLAGLSYNQSIGKVAAELIQKGGYDNYIKYRRETATEGDGKFKYHGAIDMYDKQTMRYGGWLRKYQGDNGPSQVKPTSNFTLPSLDPQAQQSADYNKGWEDYNAGVRTWTELLQEKEEKKGRALTTEEKQRWLQKAVKRNDGRKTEVDPNDPKWNFLFKESYQTWDPEFGPMTVMSKPVDVTYQMTDLDKEKARIATETRKAEMTPFAKSLGMKETDPNVQKRASQNANDQVALRILNDKPQGDRNRVEWLNTLTPQERSIIERSQYAGKLNPDYSSQFSQGFEKNLRNLNNLASQSVMPYSLYRASQITDPKRKEAYLNSLKWNNDPLWVNSEYTPEEAANASAMGVLAPLSYPTNLVTGALTGDFGSALQGQTSMPLFTDYRQPGFAAAMSGLSEAIYDPLNAVGIGIMEKVPVGKMTSQLAAKQARNFNKFLTSKEGQFYKPKFGTLDVTASPEELKRLAEIDEASSINAYNYRPNDPALSYDELRVIADNRRNEVAKTFLEKSKYLTDDEVRQIFGKSKEEILQYKPELPVSKPVDSAPRGTINLARPSRDIVFEISRSGDPAIQDAARNILTSFDRTQAEDIISNISSPMWRDRLREYATTFYPEMAQVDESAQAANQLPPPPETVYLDLDGSDITSGYQSGSYAAERAAEDLPPPPPELSDMERQLEQDLLEQTQSFNYQQPTRRFQDIYDVPIDNLSLTGELRNIPRNIKGMFNLAEKDAHHFATPAVYAQSYSTPREMLTDVTDKLNDTILNADAGQIITGSTNTSHNSFLVQMDYIAKNAGKEDLSEPIFLGYRSMNDAGFLSQANIPKTDIINYINSNLNKIQKKRGVNFNFGDKPTYMDEYGNIMIPQYGVKKITPKGEFTGIKKKDGGWIDKYQDGNQVGPSPQTITEQNQKYQDAIKWHEDWMNSPMYKQMLYEGTEYSEFPSVSNLAAGNLHSDPDDFGSVHNYDPKLIDAQRREALAGLKKTPLKIIDWKESGAGGLYHPRTKDISVYPIGYNEPTLMEHEVRHAMDTQHYSIPDNSGNPMYSSYKGIPKKDTDYLKAIKERKFEDSPMFGKLTNDDEIGDWYGNRSYIQTPTEVNARLAEIRREAQQKNIYNPFTQPIPNDFFKNFDNRALQELKNYYSDDEIQYMLNHFSENKPSKTNNLSYGKYGGWLNKYQGGSNLGEGFKKRLMKRNPGMQNVYGPEGENLNIIKDPNFDARSYGYGDIEYMAPGLEQVNYDNIIDNTLPGYTYVNPTPDKYTLVYNPKGANRGDVFLDMLHGMRNDPNYELLVQNFDKATRDAIGGDMEYYYNYDVANGYADGQEWWDKNYIDGQLRAQLAQGTLGMFSHGRRDYRKERKSASPEMRAAAKDIRKYIKGKYEDGGTFHKNQYINSVTLSNKSSWLNKYK